MAEEYLKEIEAVKVAPTIQRVAKVIDHTPKKETVRSKPLLWKIGSAISKVAVKINEKITESLDEKNKLQQELEILKQNKEFALKEQELKFITLIDELKLQHLKEIEEKNQKIHEKEEAFVLVSSIRYVF